MNRSRDFISIVIPAFNEEDRLPNTVHKIHEYLKERDEKFEIIVVDDGSTDKTARLVDQLETTLGDIKLLRNEINRGKGFSVRKGVLASSGSVVVISDADLSTPIEELYKLLPYHEKGFEIVIGSRGLKESDIVERQPWYRERMGKIFNFIVRSVAVDNIKDTQCGFKVFRTGAAQKIFRVCRVDRFCFDVEVLFIARKMGYGIKEVPIKWINSPNSRVRILRDSLKMFIDVFAIRLNWMRGLYK